MKKRSVVAGLGVGVAIAGLLTMAVAISPWYTEAAGHHAEARVHVAGRYYPYPPGVSAIQPSRQVTGRSQAGYGRAEVEQFLANRPGLMRGVPGGPSPKLGTVEFISAVQASARLNNEPVGRPGDALVCWVEIIGPLDVSNVMSVPPSLAATAPRITSAAKEILVFDGQTGNLLLSTYGA